MIYYDNTCEKCSGMWMFTTPIEGDGKLGEGRVIFIIIIVESICFYIKLK